jgi:hypothetical protein
MIREAENRRNLFLIVSYAHHKPEEVDKITPKAEGQVIAASADSFEEEPWW